MHFLTAFRISCNRLSKAKRWGSVRTGARRSCRRDSLIMSLSRYSGSAKSWSRNNVVLFILEKKKSDILMQTSCGILARTSCLSPLVVGEGGRAEMGEDTWQRTLEQKLSLSEGNENVCRNLCFFLCFSRLQSICTADFWHQERKTW